MWQRTETQRTAALMSIAAEMMGDPGLWPQEVRIDIIIHGRFKRDSEERLKTIVEQQANDVRRGLHPARFEGDTFSVTVRDRSEAPLQLTDSITIYQVQVADTPVRLNDFRSAHVVVGQPASPARERFGIS